MEPPVPLRVSHLSKRYRMAGGEAVGSTPAEFAAFIKSEQAKWSRVIKSTGIKLD